MFLRISGNTHTEICRNSLLNGIIQILSPVHSGNLLHKFIAVLVSSRGWSKILLTLNGITSQGNNILDSKKVQIKQQILYLILCRTATDYMRHYLNIELLHHSRSNCHCTGALCYGNLAECSVGSLTVLSFIPVGCHVDEWRIELHQRLNGIVKLVYIRPFQWGN